MILFIASLKVIKCNMRSFANKSYTIKSNNRLKNEITKIEELRKQVIKVGVIGDGAVRDEGLTNAFILFLHTWGSFTRNIPARPVLDAIEVKQQDFDNDTQQIMKKLLTNKLDVLTTARQIGALALSYALMSFITKGFGRWPELKPQTIANKNSNAILIGNGELRRSLTFDVVKK